jgi:hypothetical protein
MTALAEDSSSGTPTLILGEGSASDNDRSPMFRSNALETWGLWHACSTFSPLSWSWCSIGQKMLVAPIGDAFDNVSSQMP